MQLPSDIHRLGRLFLSLGALFVGCAGFLAGQPSCAPPESMKDRFAGQPDVSALNELGYWFGDQKNYNCAVQAFATSLQINSKQKEFPAIAFMLGVNLYLSGNTTEAISALREAEKFGYNDIRIHLLLAQALDEMSARPDAEQEWRAAVEIDPEHFVALDHLSNDLIADKNDEAVIQLLDTRRLAPLRTVQQDVNLGLAYAHVANFDAAARVLRDAVNTYPDSASLAQQLADLLTEHGEHAEAAAVLENARERQSSPQLTAH